MVQFSQCMDCKHFIKNDKGTMKCKAFKNGIPDDLFWNKVIHDKPYNDDNGITFEEIKE